MKVNMMNVNFDQIIIFVRRAIDERLKVITRKFFDEISIFRNSDEYISMTLTNTYVLNITTKYGTFIVNLTEQEVHKYKVLHDEAREYCIDRSIETFNNFFSEDKSSAKDINDLNDED